MAEAESPQSSMEEELRNRAEQVGEMESELQLLRDQCRQLQHELDEAKSAVTIAECTAENQVAVEKRKYQEEIATLQQILKEEVAGRYESEIKRLKKVNEKLEVEKQHYRKLYEKQVEPDSELRSKEDSLLSPNVLSAVTKSLAKRVPSLSPSAGGTPVKTVPSSSSSGPSSSEQENLEDSMKKVNSRYAQEDAELLRSLVVPLEEEIHALKEKLREQDAQLRAHEAQQQAAIESSDIMGQLLQGKPTAEVLQELDEKLKGVSSNLEVEKSTRADLEMYVAIQNTKNTALQNEYDRLRSQMAELRVVLEQEKRQHNELKHTWQRAIDQFLESQRLNIIDLRRMQSVLTHEQLRRLEELQKEEGSLSSSIRASPLSSLPESVPWADKPSPSSSLPAKSPQSKKKCLTESQESEGEQSRVQDSSDDTASLPLDLKEREGGGDDSSSLTEGEEFLGSSLASRFSPDKIPHLTEDQQKALIDISGEGDFSLLESDTGKEEETLEDGRRLVSEKEWVMLQQEIRQIRSSVSRTCHMCANYEKQLQKVQSEYREVEKQRDVLEKAIARYQEDLNREGLYRRQMEDKWKELASEYEKKVTEVYRQVETTHARQNELVTHYRSIATQLQEQLRTLTQRREQVQKELTRLQKDNDSLMGKHSKHSQEMQNEIINLPNNMEDMQLMLLRCHEDIIAAKVAKEHVESTLKSEILFLKDQILAEQHEKETIEDRLSAEVDQLREKVAILESVESQVESEQKLRADSDSKAKELKSKLNESQMKSQQIISGLKTQASENIQAKTRLESEVLELKGRIATLQQELDTSEAVQRDFVRLSQSLQVELEKIRQSQTEVRWQHEEDVDDCNNCKVRFSVGRRKNHCKHCGKIFCADCVSKTVHSGPNKLPSKVCDVCHTLLVQDATPYFSTEPPHSPE